MVIYLVYCEYFQEPTIEKAFTDVNEAIRYAKLQNERYNSKCAWYIENLPVDEPFN